MNLGDVMRELGLDSLVPDSRSRDADEESAEEEAAEETDEPADADAAEAEEPAASTPHRARIAPDQFEGDVGDAIEELRYDLDDVEGRVDSTETTIESVQNEQERIDERLDEIQETNATLLGVYDRLTEDINPFSGSANRENVGPDDGTYGVMSGEAPDESPPEPASTGEDESGDESEEEVVSFSDLKSELSEDEEEPEADEEPAEPEPEPQRAPPVAESAESGPDTGDTPYLDALAPTYATDVLLMQWVSMLVDTAGPAGALKTLDYYAQINWISPAVKRQLETVLSGAYDVDGTMPSRPPSELSVEAHNESFEHIQRLAQQTELVKA